MAEEILYEWTHPNKLVHEAMGAIFEGETPTRHKLWSVFTARGIVAEHKLRFIDAHGREVEFPIKVVSDTHIVSVREE